MQDHKCSELIYCSLFHLAKTRCRIELCWRNNADVDLHCIFTHIFKLFCLTCVWLEEKDLETFMKELKMSTKEQKQRMRECCLSQTRNVCTNSRIYEI